MSESFRTSRSVGGLTPTVVAYLLLGAVLFTCSPVMAGNAPDFKLKDLDGQWFRLDDHVGDKVIYVSFWATWCVPCRREMPHLEALWQELGDDGLLVVGVNTDPASARSKIKPYVQRHRLTYQTVLDPDNNVLDTYNPTRELPYAVLIDRDGNIFKTFSGYRTGDEKIVEEHIRQLLGQAGASAAAEGGEPAGKADA